MTYSQIKLDRMNQRVIPLLKILNMYFTKNVSVYLKINSIYIFIYCLMYTCCNIIHNLGPFLVYFLYGKYNIRINVSLFLIRIF